LLKLLTERHYDDWLVFQASHVTWKVVKSPAK